MQLKSYNICPQRNMAHSVLTLDKKRFWIYVIVKK